MDADDDLRSVLPVRNVGVSAADVATLSAGSDEELDALIHEALTGVETSGIKATTTGTTRRGERTHMIAVDAHHPRREEEGRWGHVLSASLSPQLSAGPTTTALAEQRVGSPSGANSDTDSELTLMAALNLEKSEKDREEEEEERIVREALMRLTSPAAQFAFEKEQQNGNDDVPVFALAVQVAGEQGASATGATNKDKERGSSVKSNYNNTTCYGCGQNAEDDAFRQVLKEEGRAERQPHSPEKTNAKHLPVFHETLRVAQDLENEKQVLSAILNAVHDGQSSISGDLVVGDDESDVEAVLRHAEDVAASLLQEKKRGRANRVLHLHENIELREKLRRACGSVGWPSCVCTRAATVVVEADLSAHATSPLTSSLPTAMTTSSSSLKRPTMCIGTTLGVLLLCDAKRKIYSTCGSDLGASVESRGAVVSLSMSFDASTVLSGHERGVLVLWDTDALTALREITGEFTTPITCMRHLYMDPFRAIVLHSGGGVKLVSFTRIMFKTVYRLTSVAVSLAEAPFNDIDIAFLKGEEIYLIAAISAEELFIYVLGCGFQNVTAPLIRRSHPATSARMHELVRFVSTTTVGRVFFCVAWGADVEIFAIETGGSLTKMQRMANIRLERPLHAMTSIADSCLLLLDQNDSLHLLDAGAGVVVETQALNDVEPVAFSSRSCGTRHNGALASSGPDAILLGRRRVFSCTLLSWRTRLDSLVKQRRFLEALELAKAFALEVALAVVGLHGDSAARRVSIHSYLVDLVPAYLTDAINAQSSQNSLVEIITCIIEFCASIDAMDVFFGSAMDCLRKDSTTHLLALYCLEECILSGAVTSLPEMYIQPFFDLFLHETLPIVAESTRETGTGGTLRGALRAEQALMRLDNAQEILMRIAAEHNLLQLTVTILSYRQSRYVDALRVALQKDRKESVALTFFECTAKGLTIVAGIELPEQQRRTAKEQLWKHLLTSTDDFMALFRIDPERTLRVIFSSLEENGPDSFWQDMLLRVECVTQLFRHLVGVELSSSTPLLRPCELARRVWPPYVVVHQLFTGLVHLLLSGAIVLDPLQPFCEHACSHFIYQFQTSQNEKQRRTAQEDLAALFTGTFTRGVEFAFVEEELRQRQMSRALAALHCSRWEYARAIDCYLEEENNRADPGLSGDVFEMLSGEMNRALYLGEEKMAQGLRRAVTDRVSSLVAVDASLLAQFILDYLLENYEEVMDIFRNSGETFFRYLDELVAREDPKMVIDVKLQNTYIELLCVYDPSRVYTHLSSRDSVLKYDLDVALHAVKQHKIADASVFLLEKNQMIDTAVKVAIDDVVEKLCGLRREVINHVVAASEKHAQTTPLRLSVVTSAHTEDVGIAEMMRMTRENQEGVKQHDAAPFWAGEEALKRALNVGIDLFTKHHDELADQSTENWFCLLELFTRPRLFLCDRQNQHNAALQSALDPVDGFEDDEIQLALASKASSPTGSDGFYLFLSGPLSARGVVFLEHMISLYTKYVSYIFTHMIRVLRHSSVLCRFAKDHEREPFGSFKPLIVDIVSSLEFELETNRLCKISMDEDVLPLCRRLHRDVNAGVVPLSDACYICGERFGNVRGTERETSVRVYACGHGYHEVCAAGPAGGGECVQCRNERAEDTGPVVWRSRGTNADDREKEERQNTGILGGRNGNNENGGHKKSEERKREEEEERERNLARILQRLQHTRAKVDRTENCRDLLCGFLGLNNAPVPSMRILKESMGGSLLAPAPPLPISLGDFSTEALDCDANLTLSLTDEELLELFGAGVEEESGECVLSIGDGVEFQLDTAASGGAK